MKLKAKVYATYLPLKSQVNHTEAGDVFLSMRWLVLYSFILHFYDVF